MFTQNLREPRTARKPVQAWKYSCQPAPQEHSHPGFAHVTTGIWKAEAQHLLQCSISTRLDAQRLDFRLLWPNNAATVSVHGSRRSPPFHDSQPDDY